MMTRIEIEVSPELRKFVEGEAAKLCISVEAFMAAFAQGVLYTRPTTKDTPKASA